MERPERARYVPEQRSHYNQSRFLTDSMSGHSQASESAGASDTASPDSQPDSALIPAIHLGLTAVRPRRLIPR